MSDRQTPDTESNLPELWMILQDLEDRTLTPDQRQELMTRLENSQTERQAYLEYFQQSAVFKMEGAKNDKLANEVLQGIEAGYGLEVAFGAPGIGPKDVFNGFDETNKSAQLLADEKKSAIIDLGGPKGVTQREGAVSFWIRRLPDNQKEEALWLAGENKSGGSAPEIAPIHTILTASGRIRLFIENGKFDIELTSSRKVADGK
ncbi:MAG: hypothetical protein ACJAVK_001408 [Akkermansiaceae bacterium]|jgi:hypothetical protein